ncbi:hypothetical protein FOZ63_022573, partial [Perkinsus olseni]
SQPYVLLVMGDGVKGATAATVGFSEATDLKFLTSKAGKPYCLLSFGDKSRALNCVSEYFSDKARFGVVKEFDTNYKRNSRHGDLRDPLVSNPTVNNTPKYCTDLRDLLSAQSSSPRDFAPPTVPPPAVASHSDVVAVA